MGFLEKKKTETSGADTFEMTCNHLVSNRYRRGVQPKSDYMFCSQMVMWFGVFSVFADLID